MNIKPTVRYGLEKTARIFRDKEELYIRDIGDCFIDLLEPLDEEGSCNQVKIKIFCPDGSIIDGVTVIGYSIILKNKIAIFDGRFNSTQHLD